MGMADRAPRGIPTYRRVEYTRGFLELGLLPEAAVELRKVAAADRARPDVQLVQIDLFMAARQWDRVVVAARRLARQAPDVEGAWIAWAYALREVQDIGSARKVLIEAEVLHGTCAVLQYNLACYNSLLGDRMEARRRLKRVAKMDAAWLESALDDRDLEALWPEIARMVSKEAQKGQMLTTAE